MSSSAPSKLHLEYEVAKSAHAASEWVVEAIGPDGEIYVTIFSGPAAETRAREYAKWKSQDH